MRIRPGLVALVIIVSGALTFPTLNRTAAAQLPAVKAPAGAPAETLSAWDLISRAFVNNFAFSDVRVTVAYMVIDDSRPATESGIFDSDAENTGIRKELLPVIETLRRPVAGPFYGPDHFGPVRQTEIDGKAAQCFFYERNFLNFYRSGAAKVDSGEVCFERERGVLVKHVLNGQTWFYSDFSKEFNGKMEPRTVVFDAPPYHGKATLQYSKPAPPKKEEPPPYKDWSLLTQSGLVQFTAHGKTVYGHQFGFIKKAGHCDQDLLWLSWSTYEKGLEAFQETSAAIQFKVGSELFPMDVPLLAVNAYTPTITVTTFTNAAASEKFIALLQAGKNVDITLTGPKELLQHFDVKMDAFSLIGFTAGRQKAREICEELK